jgi:hypothetical protein
MTVGKVNRGGTAAPRDPGALSSSEQDAILKLVNQEKKKPAGGGKPGGPIVARYLVVRPEIVARYLVVQPWQGIDAHQAVVNKVVKDGKLTKSEAAILRKMFNHDIATEKKHGNDISDKVRMFLGAMLANVKMDAAAKKLIFGKGGPAAEQASGPIVAKYVIQRPIGIVSPNQGGGPITAKYLVHRPGDSGFDDKPLYILPPNGKPHGGQDPKPIYILPPNFKPKK